MHINNEKSKAIAERLGFLNEGMVERDLQDCVSGLPENDWLYTRTHLKDLPPLDVSWSFGDDGVNGGGDGRVKNKIALITGASRV